MSVVRARFAAVVACCVLAACDRATPEVAATAPVRVEYMGVGTFNSADAAAGTVNISHAPVPAAGWPAMTMDFKLAEPALAAGLEAGDRVDIHFTINTGMDATLTHIAPIE